MLGPADRNASKGKMAQEGRAESLPTNPSHPEPLTIWPHTDAYADLALAVILIGRHVTSMHRACRADAFAPFAH